MVQAGADIIELEPFPNLRHPMPAEQVHLCRSEKEIVLPRPGPDRAAQLNRVEIHQARVQARHVQRVGPRLDKFRFIPATEQIKFPMLNRLKEHHVRVADPERAALGLHQFLDPLAFGNQIDPAIQNAFPVNGLEQVRQDTRVQVIAIHVNIGFWKANSDRTEHQQERLNSGWTVTFGQQMYVNRHYSYGSCAQSGYG